MDANPLPGHGQWRERPSQGNLSHQISDFPPGAVPSWTTAMVNRERHFPKATCPTKSLPSLFEMFLSWAMALPTNMVFKPLNYAGSANSGLSLWTRFLMQRLISQLQFSGEMLPSVQMDACPPQAFPTPNVVLNAAKHVRLRVPCWDTSEALSSECHVKIGNIFVASCHLPLDRLPLE